jgi:hypothetical protein
MHAAATTASTQRTRQPEPRAGADKVPEEPDATIVAAFLTFTVSPFLI